MIKDALQFLFDRGQMAAEPKIVERDEYIGALVHPNQTLVDLTRTAELYAERPKRPRGTTVLTDIPSFAHHVSNNTGLDDYVAIYVHTSEGEPPRFNAIYNESGWGDHRARYEAKFSRQWKLWTGISKQPLSQGELAEFIMDNTPDIVEPATAELLKVATNFKATVKGSFGGQVNLQDGSVVIAYENTNNTGQLKVPEAITLAIPVFEHDAPYRIDARFRYRLGRADVGFWFELVKAERYIEDATEQMIEKVRDAIPDPKPDIFRGVPSGAPIAGPHRPEGPDDRGTGLVVTAPADPTDVAPLSPRRDRRGHLSRNDEWICWS